MIHDGFAHINRIAHPSLAHLATLLCRFAPSASRRWGRESYRQHLASRAGSLRRTQHAGDTLKDARSLSFLRALRITNPRLLRASRKFRASERGTTDVTDGHGLGGFSITICVICGHYSSPRTLGVPLLAHRSHRWTQMKPGITLLAVLLDRCDDNRRCLLHQHSVIDGDTVSRTMNNFHMKGSVDAPIRTGKRDRDRKTGSFFLPSCNRLNTMIVRTWLQNGFSRLGVRSPFLPPRIACPLLRGPLDEFLPQFFLAGQVELILTGVDVGSLIS